MLVQVAMYKLVAKQGLAGLSLQATSGGLCSLQGFVEDVVPWCDDAWGTPPPSRSQPLALACWMHLLNLYRCTDAAQSVAGLVYTHTNWPETHSL